MLRVQDSPEGRLEFWYNGGESARRETSFINKWIKGADLNLKDEA